MPRVHRLVFIMLTGHVPQDLYKRSLQAFWETVLRRWNFWTDGLHFLRSAQA